MPTIRPIYRHFILWAFLLPFFFVEAWAFGGFLNEWKLASPSFVKTVDAEVTHYRKNNSQDGEEVQYRFQAEGGNAWYTASDITGRRNLWMPISPLTYQKVKMRDMTIPVVYLPENPWANKPVEEFSNFLGDAFCGWAIFLAVDAFSVFELWRIIREYLRCLRAAEKGEVCQLRYWESRSR